MIVEEEKSFRHYTDRQQKELDISNMLREAILYKFSHENVKGNICTNKIQVTPCYVVLSGWYLPSWWQNCLVWNPILSHKILLIFFIHTCVPKWYPLPRFCSQTINEHCGHIFSVWADTLSGFCSILQTKLYLQTLLEFDPKCFIYFV